MRKSNQQTIGEVIREFLKQNSLDKKLLHALVIKEWENIVGPLFAKHTQSIYFHEKKLVLEIQSPSLRNELLMQKSILIEKVNKTAGEQLITEIVLKDK
jgi:predicted nucleic acid-binding Zn ribbon protein